MSARRASRPSSPAYQAPGASTRRSSVSRSTAARRAVSIGPARLRPEADRRDLEFDYQLEMYKPAAKRRWGYYALRSSMATAWWASSTPRPTSGRGVADTAIHEDVDFSSTVRAAVDGEIRDLAQWLELEIDAR